MEKRTKWHFWIGLRKVKSDFVWLDSSVASFQAWGEVGKEAGVETVATGLLVGFGSMLGLLVVGFLLLQLPCCRTYTVKTIGHFGLGTR
nr:hypothetical protein BaRGS_024873 [Batillaria attramentaria]